MEYRRLTLVAAAGAIALTGCARTAEPPAPTAPPECVYIGPADSDPTVGNLRAAGWDTDYSAQEWTLTAPDGTTLRGTALSEDAPLTVCGSDVSAVEEERAAICEAGNADVCREAGLPMASSVACAVLDAETAENLRTAGHTVGQAGNLWTVDGVVVAREAGTVVTACGDPLVIQAIGEAQP